MNNSLTSVRTRPGAVRPTLVRRRHVDPREPRPHRRSGTHGVLGGPPRPRSQADLVSVTIIRNEQGTPAGTLADAKVIVQREAGPLSGLAVIGFAGGNVAREGDT